VDYIVWNPLPKLASQTDINIMKKLLLVFCMAACFSAGYSQRGTSLADRNPQKFVDIYKAKDSDFVKETIKIYHDTIAPSGLKVTVLQ